MNALVATTNTYPFSRCINGIVSCIRVANNAVAKISELAFKYLIDAAVRGEKTVTAQHGLHSVSNDLTIVLKVIEVRMCDRTDA